MSYKEWQESPEWLKQGARREAAELARLERADRRKGKPHPVDPTDPWTNFVRRPCEPNCPWHQS